MGYGKSIYMRSTIVVGDGSSARRSTPQRTHKNRNHWHQVIERKLTLVDLAEWVGARAARNSTKESNTGSQYLEHRTVNSMGDFTCAEILGIGWLDKTERSMRLSSRQVRVFRVRTCISLRFSGWTFMTCAPFGAPGFFPRAEEPEGRATSSVTESDIASVIVQ